MQRLFTSSTFYGVGKLTAAIHLALLSGAAMAQSITEQDIEVVSVTGSRIARTEVVSTSPVTSVEEFQLQLDRAVNVEDIIFKLPQAPSSGASGGSATTIDLRALGQNRTLVLLDGTRDVPFGFRNSVDVNAIPAGLIKRVDVLTGGAAAVYGADAVSGVVNFIMDDTFDGVEFSTSYEMPQNGAEMFSAEAIFGGDILDGKGHLTGFVSFADRKALFAGDRDFAMENGTQVVNTGGYYEDIVSGNTFGIDDNGAVTEGRNTVDSTAGRYLVSPMTRKSTGLFWDVDLHDNATLYGRALYSQMEVYTAGGAGQTPVSVNEEVLLSRDNPFITSAIADQLTFDENGVAQVRVERNLGLGLQKTITERDRLQFQVGLRGDITDFLRYDAYFQHGKTDETDKVLNSGYSTTASGGSSFAAIANSVDLFNPNVALNELETTLVYHDRERTQNVASITFSGESTPLFELPAGPVSFAIGYEYRREAGVQMPGDAFRRGTTFSSSSSVEIDASFYSRESYAEVLVPLVYDKPFMQSLDFEGAYRVSSYSNTDADDTHKLGLNWTVNDDWRVRWTRQSAFRAPNLGEFAGPVSGLSLAIFDPYNERFISRLAGRFEGDPCLLGTGDAEQCSRYGAPAVGTEWDSSSARYTYGGNPDIRPEKADSTTVGFVYTPTYLDGFDLTVDWYKIEIDDAIWVIQPAAALQNCYIDNPVAGNPLCDAVLRDPNTGFITTALVNDFNVSTFLQEGVDVTAQYRFAAPEFMGGDLTLNYAANLVTKAEKRLDPTLPVEDCKGTYGSACTGDYASSLQADYKHRLSVGWSLDEYTVQLSWRRIGDVDYASDPSVSIGSQNYFDVAASWQVSDEVSVGAGVDNLFDKAPPVPAAGATRYNTVDGYDVVGRSIGVSLRYTPAL